jgi:hypothetical protein
MNNKDIAVRCRKFAEAQRHMAANTKEDFTFWHHIAVAETLELAAKRIDEIAHPA